MAELPTTDKPVEAPKVTNQSEEPNAMLQEANSPESNLFKKAPPSDLNLTEIVIPGLNEAMPGSAGDKPQKREQWSLPEGEKDKLPEIPVCYDNGLKDGPNKDQKERSDQSGQSPLTMGPNGYATKPPSPDKVPGDPKLGRR